MELQLSFPGTIFCLVFFALVMLKLRKRSKTNVKLPPGPWKLPIIGHLHHLIGSQPHIALRDLANKYGGLMYLQLGEIPTLVVSSTEYVEEITKTHDVIFAYRPKSSSMKILTYNYSSITFAPYGEYWRQLRKICVLELLSNRRVQSLRPIREEVVSKLITWLYSKTGSSINLTENIFSSTYNAAARIVLSDETAEKKDEFISYINEATRLGAGFNVGDVFPSIKLFGLISGTSSELETASKKGSKLLGDIIGQHIKAKAESRTKKKEEDVLDVLLKFHKSDDEFTLTTDNIKAIIQDLFGAAGDTSATLTDWAMTEMIKHPRVIEKAQAEVRQVFDSRTSVDETGLSELKYMKLVIKETLRLHPPAPLIPRENTTQRCEINGYEIPMETKVLLNAWAIGRDPKFWGVDAERFYPERFVDDSVDFKGTNYGYIPFGVGRRTCPGMAFGLSNVELLLSQLLYCFDWKLPGSMTPQDLDMTGAFAVTVRRKDDLYLIPTPYKRQVHVSKS